ncbi:MAG: UDP-N-acetylmuramate--L-alanine ligase, partial [Flavobacteriales bacterium]|nr:UDP-N-acetylmuramate--L-alanine ligase [Flavobacteriales bacterium]
MNEVRRYFFIGIGGIGMSALARYFAAEGCQVAGYDKTSSTLTESLKEEGIEVIYNDEVDNIPAEFRRIDEWLTIVRTPAVPLDSELNRFYKEKQASVKKRSEILASIANSKRCIAVAGTHGKTTTTSILGHILFNSSLGCTAFVGGILSQYDSNVLIDPKSPFVVLEADEFDRSFHHLNPEIAVVTSTDADHLDIYGSQKEFELAFSLFLDKVHGRAFVHSSIPKKIKGKKSLSYGIEDGDIQAIHIRVENGRFHFDLEAERMQMLNVSISLPGRHNILNALAAVSVCKELGLDNEQIRSGISSYKGVKRRFEFVSCDESIVFIDDYAHHPSEINACISSVRELYPNRKITAVFQPHLFSRTRDFMEGFAISLSAADEVILVPIYP